MPELIDIVPERLRIVTALSEEEIVSLKDLDRCALNYDRNDEKACKAAKILEELCAFAEDVIKDLEDKGIS